MPRGDRTGPEGIGPRTGRGLGYCNGYDHPGYTKGITCGKGGYGRGFGRGLGRGYGRGFSRGRIEYIPPVEEVDRQISNEEEEKIYLENEVKNLENELKQLKNRLEDLKKE